MDELLSINGPWSQEFSIVLKFWIYASCLWLSVLFLEQPQDFSIHTALMIKHLGNCEKILPNEGHLERFTELHGEEEERDRSDQVEKRGSQERRDQYTQ